MNASRCLMMAGLVGIVVVPVTHAVNQLLLYNFEINTNASRARRVGVHRDRAQIRGRL